MSRLVARGYTSLDYEQSADIHGFSVTVSKRNGSTARFLMDEDTFTAWMRCDDGKHLASVSSLHWSFTGDTEQSLKDELDIETDADVESRRMADEIRRSIGEPGYHSLGTIAVGQEVSLARMVPTHLMSFMNHEGREVAYIDQNGNYVKVSAASPPPPPPEPAPIVSPDVSGRIIDLE